MKVLIKNSIIHSRRRRRHPDQYPDCLPLLIISVDQGYLAFQPTLLRPSRKPPIFVYRRMKLLKRFYLLDGRLQCLISYTPSGRGMKPFPNVENVSDDLTF